MTAPSRSTTQYAVGVQDELVSLTLRMVDDYPELPAGSVMRCVARAVRLALAAGAAGEEIPAEAERTARHALARRSTGTPDQRPRLATADGTQTHRGARRDHHECDRAS